MIHNNGVMLKPATSGLRKLSLNVSPPIAERLRKIAYENHVSESSIVEIALRVFFESGDDEYLGTELRRHGATLRRKYA